MTHRILVRTVLSVLFLALSLTSPALPNTAILTANCAEPGTAIAVEFNVTTPLPEDWIGWVVDRWAIGFCGSLQHVFGPEAFPSGAGSWAFSDASATSGTAYKYVLWAVDAQGERHHFTEEAFDDRWTAYTYTSCGDPSVFRGTLYGYDGERARTMMCSGCWEYISYVQDLPADLLPLVGTNTHVELVGELHFGPEGPYITDVTDWWIAECGEVATRSIAWSTVKALYR